MPHEDDPGWYHRRSIRLSGYDYGQAGAYFVTLCAYEHVCLFGAVSDSAVQVNDLGRVVEEEWLRTPKIRPQVELDAYVIMPNHLHAILLIVDDAGLPTVGAYCNTPLPPKTTTPGEFRSPSQTLGAIIRGFKSATTKRINLLRQSPGTPVWQRNYYEHIIRDEADRGRIQTYIANNPAQWEIDHDNPSLWFR